MTDTPRAVTGRAARSQDPGAVDRRATLDAWHKSVSDRSVAEIIRYRDLRGFTNDQLRERLSVLGWDLTRDSLASILATKRKMMPITDLLLFAQALYVPAVALIFPVWSNDPVELWPDAEERATAYEAARWLYGKNPEIAAPDAIREADVVDDYYEVGDIVSRLEDIEGLLHAVDAIHWNLSETEEGSEKRDEWEIRFQRATEEVAEQRKFLKSVYKGIKLPALRPALAFLDERNYTIPPLPLAGYDTPWEAELHASMKTSEVTPLGEA